MDDGNTTHVCFFWILELQHQIYNKNGRFVSINY